MSDKDELEPCPFCNGKDVKVQPYWNGEWFYAYCWGDDCGAQGPERRTPASAIKAWNQRSKQEEA
jgi:Lar family restriction alleviation protein